MPLLLFFLYLIVEIGVLVWLASTIGILWTIALMIGTSVLGVALVRSQGRRVLSQLRAAAREQRSSGTALADGALVAGGSILLAIPGLVCSVLGLLLLIPPTRALVRPFVNAAAHRMIARIGGGAFGRSAVIIDGEVVGGHEPHDRRAGHSERRAEAPLVIDAPDLRTPPHR